MISRSQNVLVIIIISSWVTEQSFSLETEMLFLFPLPENPATFKAYFSLMWRKILKNKTGYAYYLALPSLHPYEGDPLKLYHDPKSERKKDTLACLNSTVCIAYMRSNPPPNPPPHPYSRFSFFLLLTSDLFFQSLIHRLLYNRNLYSHYNASCDYFFCHSLQL